MRKRKALFLGLMAALVAGFALGGEAIPNWSAPATWTPTKSAGLHTLTDVTFPVPFIGITPCRVADTRGNGFVGAYGPPSLVANANRNFTITGQCGIPSGADAVSFNFAALNVGGNGDLRVFPAGAVLPLVSTLNYNANTPNIANAAIVPLGAGGAITVRADAVPVDLIIDVNGYYTSTPNASEPFNILSSCNCGVNFGSNTGSGGYPTSGVRGNVTGTGANAAGVLGESFSTASGPHGVFGRISSTASDASAVLGEDGVGAANVGGGFFSTGVIGNGRNGVLGRTSTPVGDGLIGIAQDTAGTKTADGRVGAGGNAFLAVLGGYAAPEPVLTIDPHPTNASVVIAYPSLSGNEAGTYFRGTAQTTEREFVINVPEDFRMVTDAEGLTVQLTPVGSPASMYVVSEDLNQIVVRSSRDVKFHYLVQGVRVGHKAYSPVQDAMSRPVFLPQGPEGLMLTRWPEYIKQRLIANGTYNPDGTINMQTAERAGWAQMWRESEEQSRAAAAKRIKSREESQGNH